MKKTTYSMFEFLLPGDNYGDAWNEDMWNPALYIHFFSLNQVKPGPQLDSDSISL